MSLVSVVSVVSEVVSMAVNAGKQDNKPTDDDVLRGGHGIRKSAAPPSCWSCWISHDKTSISDYERVVVSRMMMMMTMGAASASRLLEAAEDQ
uniref:Uncharacterized protein n=1 Tax=Pristionchus pacificus TaxID=54126 RepID=A0A2A6BJX2_PRIPA|eukprot:PDM66187.1 hypothetical protein PRIPAC_45412 [Pristionchus pacificus]